MTSFTQKAAPPAPGFADLYTPKLVTVLREGYGLGQLRADAIAGLTVAIVALPLSIAIAVASGASPAQGLITAIIGGFLVSALGGSRFQIGGPAGAFIVLVNTTAATHGMDGLILAVLLSGMMLALAGWLRLGTFVKFVPYPVTVGFTAGIAIIIGSSQLKDLFGLTLSGAEPGPFLEKLPALAAAAPTADWHAFAIAAGTMAVIFTLKRFRPGWPGILLAVVLAAIVTAAANFDIATVGSRFGAMPAGLPMPHVPAISMAKVMDVLPAAISFTLLGAIESLLSAVVADGMTGRRHRSNCELVAQGAANIGSALFGGICVTGTIARTATNVRAGAHGPVSGMLHSVFLLGMMILAAPLIAFIPMAALAGVLAVVAWNMFEKHAFWRLLNASKGDAAVLLATFGLTVFRDLTEAIIVGFALGAALFIQRMSQAATVELGAPLVRADEADDLHERVPYDEATSTRRDVIVYRISGAFFFGAAATIGSVLDRIGDQHRALIVDFSQVPFIDSTAAHTIEGLVEAAHRRKIAVWLTGLSPANEAALAAHGVEAPLVNVEPDISTAQAQALSMLDGA
ncbi:SulP family inorganic anion transporter [Hyphomonas sp.]|uniref:SulP family inorganic anion transporter n=1 Tax=Hyphomonas sp. TaxID=87 RepID=UPI000C3AFD04|nr:SulP family inorganic anion transporter [Hyphomonas sp.]MAU67226.1 sodium-independent anion transporter [Hyphomonas sp.]